MVTIIIIIISILPTIIKDARTRPAPRVNDILTRPDDDEDDDGGHGRDH